MYQYTCIILMTRIGMKPRVSFSIFRAQDPTASTMLQIQSKRLLDIQIQIGKEILLIGSPLPSLFLCLLVAPFSGLEKSRPP